MGKTINVLLVTYYFSPTGTPRSLRWLNFVEELSGEKDLHFDILTIQPSIYHEKHDPRMSMPGDAVRIFRTYPGPIYSNRYRKPRSNIVSKATVETKFSRIAKFLLAPDKGVEWIPWGYHIGCRLLKETDYDVIISSGYPFSSHLLGYLLKRRSRAKWIADYGDPWSFNPDTNLLPMKRREFDRRMERHLLENCDKVIVTTSDTKDGFLENFAFLRDSDVEIISQGYDPHLYSTIEPERGSKFRIVYTGTFYDKLREPYELYNAVNAMGNLDFELVIAGDIPEKFRTKNEKVIYLGHQSHKRSISLQKGADVLIFFGNDSSYPLPGKIFEYIAARRPILIVKYNQYDKSVDLIEKHNRGISVMYDSSEIAAQIEKLYFNSQENRLADDFNLDVIEDYSWNALSGRLDKLIRQVAEMK